MANVALYIALLVATRIVPRLPTRIAYAIADFVADLAYLAVVPARRGIEANLAAALEDISPAERKRTARRAFLHDARNWVDTLSISRLTPAEVSAAVEVEGWHHVTDAVGTGKGAVLISFHLGNFDLVGQILAIHGFRLTVPIERMRPDALFQMLKQQRESLGIHLVPVEHASRALLAALRRGELIGATIDRNLAGKGVVVDVFGHPTTLARGPIALSARTGAPLLLGLGVRVGERRYRGFVVPIKPSANPLPGKEGEAVIAQEIAELMEHYIREFPEQWMAFRPLWGRRQRANSAATIGRNTGAAI